MKGIGQSAALAPGDIVIVSGRAGTGKSTLGTALAAQCNLPLTRHGWWPIPQSFDNNNPLGQNPELDDDETGAVNTLWDILEEEVVNETLLVIDHATGLIPSAAHVQRLIELLNAPIRAAIVLCFFNEELADAVTPEHAYRVRTAAQRGGDNITFSTTWDHTTRGHLWTQETIAAWAVYTELLEARR